jgi:hypothetical protein
MKAAALGLAAVLVALPAAAQDTRQWFLNESGDDVMLVYGTPDSDDLWAGLSCRRGSNEASAHLVLEHSIGATKTDNEVWLDKRGEPEPWEVKISLAGVRVEASALPDEMNGGSTLSVELLADGPVLKALARQGRLRAKALGEVVDPPPFPKEQFERFRRLCSGG